MKEQGEKTSSLSRFIFFFFFFLLSLSRSFIFPNLNFAKQKKHAPTKASGLAGRL